MIRPARPQDVPQIHRLIRELADYERSLSEVTATEGDLRRALFADQPAVFAHVAEHEGAVAGFALWFLNYSTWQAGTASRGPVRHPRLRGAGLGRALRAELARICVRQATAGSTGGSSTNPLPAGVLRASRRGRDGGLDGAPADRPGLRHAYCAACRRTAASVHALPCVADQDHPPLLSSV
jgi:GNAT superfamily N-acetyltransferase